jgi:hypothetical protein
MLMLRRGSIGDRHVVSSQWIERCTSPIVSVDEVRRFGYHWFMADIAFGKPLGWAPGRLERTWMAFGEGGQRLFLIPGLKLAVAITAGNYGADDQGIPPTRVLREVVLESIL